MATQALIAAIGWGDVATYLGDVATYLCAAVALGAAICTVIYARRAIAISRAANQLAYFSSLRAWADEVATSIETAIHVCGDLDPSQTQDPAFFERRFELLCKLSSLIERGRWFFPNVLKERDEKDQVIFRGYRHEILDSVFAAYMLVRAIDFIHKTPNAATKGRLEKVEKTFVIQIQEVLDPSKMGKEFQRLVRNAG